MFHVYIALCKIDVYHKSNEFKLHFFKLFAHYSDCFFPIIDNFEFSQPTNF